MAKRKKTKGQTVIYKTLHKKTKIWAMISQKYIEDFNKTGSFCDVDMRGFLYIFQCLCLG
jgi:hypothetical protein